MANSIALFKNYIDALDEVYKASSKTSILDTADGVKLNGAGYLEVPKMTMDGLGNHSRNGNYTDGEVTLTIEEIRPDYDRDRSFTVDRMDNEETAGVAFGKLSSEFIRTKVVPEIDAYRFAKYAGKAGTVVGANLGGDTVMNAIKVAITELEDKEVDAGSTYLFITPALHNSIDALDSYKSKELLGKFAGIVDVPQGRFYSAIDLKDGKSSGETAGGFVKSATGKDINFMLISKSAIIQVAKNTVNKVISPDENQLADAWKFCFRAYGLAYVYDNKVKGIYLHTKA